MAAVKLDLSDNSDVITVITRLRAAWRYIPSSEQQNEATESPGADGTCKVVTDFMRESKEPVDSQGRPETNTSRDNVFQPDPQDLEPDTPWRCGVYHMFNHVFWDASHSLGRSGADVGHFHPPSETFITVRYGEENRTTWTQDTLILPVFLAHEVTVKGTLAIPNEASEAEQQNSDLYFDEENPFELRCLQAGADITFTAERASQHGQVPGDVAAVLLAGMLCKADHHRE